jgi:prephenate dehydratase
MEAAEAAMDRSQEHAATLGYLGPTGTHCEDAANRYMRGQVDKQSFSSIREVMLAVENKVVTQGVVPLENSIEGTVNATVDLLANEVSLLIRAELVLPIKHCLLVPPGADLAKIEVVISHPQALSQCQRYLAQNLPGARWIPASSTAEAAQIVANVELKRPANAGEPSFDLSLYPKSSNNWAAIASARAAEIYELDILAENISDTAANYTRFVVVGQEDAPATGHDKTSLVFALPHRPGSLLEVLSVFAAAGINLSRIESRPSKRGLGDYWFLVDLEGHRREPRITEALERLTSQAVWCKMLGSYPVANYDKEADKSRLKLTNHLNLDSSFSEFR